VARARNIKPGFFKNELIAELPFEARLLFIGLWTLADREGRLEDRAKRIKMELFPADNVDVEPLLTLLVNSGFLVRYEVDGQRYLSIENFAKHQSPHAKEQASTIPAPDKHGATTVQALDIPAPAPPDSLIADSLNPDSKALAAKRRTKLPDDFYPDETGLSKATASGIAVSDELERFKDFHRGKGNVMADWQAAWRTWVGNAVKFAKGSNHGSSRDEDRKRTIRNLTGYDADAIPSVSTRLS